MKTSLAAKIQAANSTLMVDGDLDAVGEFFSPHYIAHLTQDELTGGHVAIRRILRLYHRAFPDMSVEVEILVESGDRVAWQRTVRATHRGTFRGFPSTGRGLVWRDMVTSRFQDGLVAEDWLVSDLAERLLLSRKPQ